MFERSLKKWRRGGDLSRTAENREVGIDGITVSVRDLAAIEDKNNSSSALLSVS